MGTKLNICNSALVKCGAEQIVSLTDTSKRASLVSLRYDAIKKVLLTKYLWNFAKTRVVLEEDEEVPAFGFTARYLLPDDYIRVVGLDPSYIKFKEESGYLLTDGSGQLNLIYIRLTDDSEFTPLFDEVLALAIADDIAYSLVQSNSLKQRISEDYKELLREARSYNAQSSHGDEFIAETYTVVRY